MGFIFMMAARRIGGRMYSLKIKNVAPYGVKPFVTAIPFKYRTHCMFTYTKMKISSAVIIAFKRIIFFKQSIC